MNWLDFFLHVAHLVLPAFGVSVLSATLAKLVWRAELAHCSWLLLAGCTLLAGVIVIIGGLVIHGQDGRMATYLALCVVCALALWWIGFVRRR